MARMGIEPGTPALRKSGALTTKLYPGQLISTIHTYIKPYINNGLCLFVLKCWETIVLKDVDACWGGAKFPDKSSSVLEV